MPHITKKQYAEYRKLLRGMKRLNKLMKEAQATPPVGVGKITVEPDPEHQRELDRISTELDLEFQAALASYRMTTLELFDEAEKYGDGYAQGFKDGFFAHFDLDTEFREQQNKAINEKYDRLRECHNQG